jgi:hypothetical protein
MIEYHFLTCNQTFKKTFKVPGNVVIFATRRKFTKAAVEKLTKKLKGLAKHGITTKYLEQLKLELGKETTMFNKTCPDVHYTVGTSNTQQKSGLKAYCKELKHDKMHIIILQSNNPIKKGGGSIIFPSRIALSDTQNLITYQTNMSFKIENNTISRSSDNARLIAIEYNATRNSPMWYELSKIPYILVNEKSETIVLTQHHVSQLLLQNPSIFTSNLGLDLDALWTITKLDRNGAITLTNTKNNSSKPGQSTLVAFSELNIPMTFQEDTISTNVSDDDNTVRMQPTFVVLRYNLKDLSISHINYAVNLINNAFIRSYDKSEMPLMNTGHYIEFVISRMDLITNVFNKRALFPNPLEGGFGWWPMPKTKTKKQTNVAPPQLLENSHLDKATTLSLTKEKVLYAQQQDRISLEQNVVNDIDDMEQPSTQTKQVVAVKYSKRVGGMTLNDVFYISKLIMTTNEKDQKVLNNNHIATTKSVMEVKEKDKKISKEVIVIDLLQKDNEKIVSMLNTTASTSKLLTFDIGIGNSNP